MPIIFLNQKKHVFFFFFQRQATLFETLAAKKNSPRKLKPHPALVCSATTLIITTDIAITWESSSPGTPKTGKAFYSG